MLFRSIELKDAAQKAKAKGYVCVAAGASDDWINSDWFVQISNEFEQGAVYAAEKGGYILKICAICTSLSKVG